MFIFLLKIVCQLIGHNLASINYTNSDEKCQENKKCKRCQSVFPGKKKDHDWGKLIFAGKLSCDRKILCNLCGASKPYSALHDWSEWMRNPEASCDEQRKCKRCNKGETREGSHDWGEWKRNSKASCDEQRKCKRCNKGETREGSHDWGEWGNWKEEKNGQRRLRYCVICNKENSHFRYDQDYINQIAGLGPY